MIRWLLIALFTYFIYVLIRRHWSGNKKNGNSYFGRNGTGRKSRKKNLDHIEEAEFEDITPKEKKNN